MIHWKKRFIFEESVGPEVVYILASNHPTPSDRSTLATLMQYESAMYMISIENREMDFLSTWKFKRDTSKYPTTTDLCMPGARRMKIFVHGLYNVAFNMSPLLTLTIAEVGSIILLLILSLLSLIITLLLTHSLLLLESSLLILLWLLRVLLRIYML